MNAQRNFSRILTMVLVLCFGLLTASAVWAGLQPESVQVTLKPGESFAERKIVTLTGVVPKGDIVFSFDLTGSMSPNIAAAQASAIAIMDSVAMLVADPRFAVVSYMDYPAFYSSCGWAESYGDSGCGDYAYRLDLPLTSDRAAVAAAINALVLGCGDDGPQDYTRVFYESYADTDLGYRPGAKRMLVNFGDNVPHDCDLNEGVPGYELDPPFSTGGDPGRDELMGTADDLDLQTVLAEMAAQNVSLLEVHGSSWVSDHWQHWVQITGGGFWELSAASEIPAAIQALIQHEVTMIDSLTLVVMTPGFEGWMTSLNPPYYADIVAPETLSFEATFTVPPGTPDGEYILQISAMGDGASFGDQVLVIKVESIILVSVDIKPRSCPNPFNVRNDGLDDAVLPVAILGVPDFDVWTVIPESLRLDGVAPVRWAYEDVAAPLGASPPEGCECTTAGPDGLMDLTLKFNRAEIVAAIGPVNDGDVVVLTLTGMTRDSGQIQGGDCLIIIKKGKSAKLAGLTPSDFALANYPNPFNAGTSIRYSLTDGGHTRLAVCNVLGQVVRTLVDEYQESGAFTVTWDGRDDSGQPVASGLYLSRLEVGSAVVTCKMSLLK